MRMDETTSEEDNPWWTEYAEEQTPKIMPQIMVRLCDNQCYREDRRPKLFGDVWFGRYTGVCKVKTIWINYGNIALHTME